MNKNQKGFGAVEALLILVIVGIISGMGWYVMKTNKDIDKSNATAVASSASTTSSSSQKSTDNKKIDSSIHEVDIKLQTEADISKLPEYTPESFKTYMLGLLKDNKFSSNGDIDTIPQYQISKISQVNISGGQVPVDKNGEGHEGGAPAIWVLTPKGTWDKESLNGPVCKSKNGGLIYEEFVKECYTANTDSWAKNPNGSITTINY